MGIQTSLDAVQQAERLIDALRLADDLAFEASRDGGQRTIRVLQGALKGEDQVAAIAATTIRLVTGSRTSSMFARELFVFHDRGRSIHASAGSSTNRSVKSCDTVPIGRNAVPFVGNGCVPYAMS